jgi:hypothetical protein
VALLHQLLHSLFNHSVLPLSNNNSSSSQGWVAGFHSAEEEQPDSASRQQQHHNKEQEHLQLQAVDPMEHSLSLPVSQQQLLVVVNILFLRTG